MKTVALSLVLILTLSLAACSPLEERGRNTAAALQGILVAAQSEYQSTCIKDSSQATCQLINRGVSAENALVTAGELYCGWSTAAPPSDPNTKCVPVKGAEAALTSAIANAAQLTLQIKGAL